MATANTFVVRRAEPRDATAIAAMLQSVFKNDVMLNYVLRDDDKRPAAMRIYFDMITDASVRAGSAFITPEISGAALWVQSNWLSRSVAVQIFSLLGLIQICGWSKTRRAWRINRLLNASEPCGESYYLLAVGVKPDMRRQGIGSALLRPILDQCDAMRCFAHLETHDDNNHGFYRKHGFRIVTTIPMNEGPTLWKMHRPPVHC